MEKSELIYQLMTRHQRRLQILKEQEASFGFSTPPHILMEIEDIEAQLRKLMAEIEESQLPQDYSPKPKDISSISSSNIGGSHLITGDKVAGDKITIGSASGLNVVIGHGAYTNINQSTNRTDLTMLFKSIYQQIAARPADPDVEKEEMTIIVEKIEQEVSKGERANLSKLNRWLGNLSEIAPDIFAQTVATLTNPSAIVAPVIRKIAENVKQ